VRAGRPSSRNRELARIHIARAQLAMDEDVYRATVRAISNQRTDSAKDLDYAEREKLLEHFRRLGWRDVQTGVRRKFTAAAKQPLMDKVAALLASSMLPWAYADSMARRMFKVERTDWLDADQLRRVVAALEYQKKRRLAAAANDVKS
jgi:phage gp16-like protein